MFRSFEDFVHLYHTPKYKKMAEETLSINLELSSFANKNGLRKIYLRITQNRKHNRIKTGFAVTDGQFDPTGNYGYWVTKHPDATLYNDALAKKIMEAKSIWSNKQLVGDFVNSEVVSDALKTGKESKDFFIFWDRKVEQMLNYNQSKGYNTTKNRHLIPFFAKIGYTTVDFRQITPSLLVDFENFLKKPRLDSKVKRVLDSDSIYSQMKRVRAMFNKAIGEGVIDPSIYPFKRYKMPRVLKNYKERLSEEEVKKFEAVKLKSGSLMFNVQKSWMLSFYCAGIRVEDLLLLKVKNIVLGRLVYQMSKTGKLKSIKVTPKIQAILDNYVSKKSKPNDYIFPFLPDYADQLDSDGREFKGLISSRTSQMNKNLKEIAKKAKIDKKITNHISRHSFANVARKKTNDIHAIKSALGHSSTKTTEIYLDDFDEEGLDAMMDIVAG